MATRGPKGATIKKQVTSTARWEFTAEVLRKRLRLPEGASLFLDVSASVRDDGVLDISSMVATGEDGEKRLMIGGGHYPLIATATETKTK